MGMKCTVWGTQPGIMYYLYMVTDCGWTYCGDHFDMYSDIKSLCHITVTNIVFRLIILQPTNLTTNKPTEKEIRFIGIGQKGNWMTVVKKYNLIR